MVEIPPDIEGEIAELERALAQKRAVLEQQKEAGRIEEIPHPKEILREALREKIAAVPGPTPPAPPPPIAAKPPAPTVQPSYFSDELLSKVHELAKIAFEKSIAEAIKIAKATQNAALLDAFHDFMVDELYSHLVETGKLEEV